MKTGFIVCLPYAVRKCRSLSMQYPRKSSKNEEANMKQACLHAPGAASSRPRTLEGPTIRFGVFFYESLIGLSFVGCRSLGPGLQLRLSMRLTVGF